MEKETNSSIINSPIGFLQIVESCGKIIEIRESDSTNQQFVKNRNEILHNAEQQIAAYFEGHLKEFSFQIKLEGTEFQKDVWEECRRIPYGQVRTYSDIAIAIGKPNAGRAVGMALRDNPILLIVPCHRVISKNGVGGFRLGSAIKMGLIELEQKYI